MRSTGMMSWNLQVLCLMGGLLACATKSQPPNFSSPESTFETWRQAASKLDLPILLETYARSARSTVEDELSRLSREALEKMRNETKATRFTVERVIFEDTTAYLRVRRQLGRADEIEVLTMVKENGEWRLLP